jgi:hypothetical protein
MCRSGTVPGPTHVPEGLFMKLNTLIGSALLLMAFGIAMPAYAQETHDQDHATKPEEGKPEDRPKQQTEPAKTPNDQPRPAEKEANAPKEQPKNTQPARQAQQDDKNREKTQQDAARKQPAQQHGRIPDEKFKASFGREHTFHVGHPVIVGGRPRFQYGGYSFFISQSWPGGWGYDDDVYIIDVNGVYYLVNNYHPGVQVELVIGD